MSLINNLISLAERIATEFNSVRTQIDAIGEANANPVVTGTVIGFAGASYTGSNWLICDGAAVSRTTYADLFNVIGTTYGAGNGTTTFNVPDYRGVFLRGLDGGRGIDSGRSLGSFQEDELEAHTHDALAGGTYPGVNAGSGGYGGARYGDAYFQTSSTGGSETRPKNVSVNYLIKT